MKVDPRTALVQVSLVKAQPFKNLLAEARAEIKKDVKPPPPVAARGVVERAKVVTSAPQAAQTRARVHADAEAQRLGTVRSTHAQHAERLASVRSEHTEAVIDRATNRLIDFITRELSQELPPREDPTRLAALGNTAHHLPPPPSLSPTPSRETSAAQAVALIEKIEVFVKSQRPGLALTLNNSLGAHVEIERIGPKEIALKLVGHRGPPTAEAVSRIRDELRARGLKVGALSVA